MLKHADIERAQGIVYAAMPPTPQYAWPLLAAATQCECWVKHENHTPVGAFKVRGGLVHMHLRKERGETNGVITATRGNHGQSIPFAARREGIEATVVVPKGNSVEKNEAMRALGCTLIEGGSDFDEARETAMRLGREQGLDMVASFHPELVMGVATYAHELFKGAGDLDTVYVPIGLGSGICGVIAVRDLLGLKTKVVGVVAEKANSYKLSFAQGRAVPTNSALSFADGMAVRVPNADALAMIVKGADRVVDVSEDEIAEAMRLYFRATHNVTEGAGAAALAALVKEQAQMAGKRVGLILSGGNIDSSKFAQVLQGRTPLA
ncbi:threonine dehydratase [Taklimakanibacter albus]|uniref:Threonine dehydratase n=1 Tax=Taklimakanibacter albus TaxID=2800327 RepID=A0ACC5R029_9HYPH|nr:threonine dehydratase [Aestuariivirga sp. YIM B02566]MBK1866022.1 threonine dehydratase [Aestuariivirga sp. YIM B02566]